MCGYFRGTGEWASGGQAGLVSSIAFFQVDIGFIWGKI